jgi:protein tyrosine phosphatase (PTP) superfamily phosphohydrolase (DUF442 family)
MNVRTFALLALLTWTTVARADELELIGRHALEGRRGAQAIEGWIEVRPDATYTGERHVGGAIEPLGGRVRIDQHNLVLTSTSGLASALPGATRAVVERRFARADDGRTIRWRWAQADVQDEELLVQPRRAGTRFDTIRRALGPGRPLNWIFNANRGVVDDADGLEILRSKQPTPNEVEGLKTEGVRTILSLNGTLDEEVTLFARDDDDSDRPAASTKVNLREFISTKGIEHVTLSMSAGRAPTEAELVAAFRVLLDDSRRPILVHCRGGSDRTGVISALYQIEFLGVSKADAKRTMRRHMWLARSGTELQGAWLDLYQLGSLRALLEREGVTIPARFRR